ncbi:MAG TPA: FadR/GntR family transcriptional regulator [Solirubrobacteraceae bacterium]|nr:FadR/GntR family transcriptional regulator [Solirubrobacteraceae bacterium]
MSTAAGSRQAPRFQAVHADASEQIAREIRRYVEREGLRPGDRIGTEHELAREFGVSRPTLREGLRRLAGSHLIRVQKGRAGGVFVENTTGAGIGRHVSESIAVMLESESVTLCELLESRMFLEVPLAGLAAELADETTVAVLLDSIATARGRDPGTEEFRLADTRFHRAIAAAAGNELLVTFTGWILDVLQPSLVAHVAHALDADEIIAQHELIVRAIRRHQRSAAERAMRQHIEYMQQVLRAVDAERR